MRLKGYISFVFIVHCGYFAQSQKSLPSEVEMERWALKINGDLQSLVENAASIDKIQEAYRKQIGKVNRYEVDGLSIAEDVSRKLSKIMNLKMKSLRKSVKAAEEAAASHEFFPFLKIADVDYVAAKKIEDNDTQFEYNPQFQQRVAMNFSSVHIPVEIYEGEAHILNSLNWSAKLDEQWIKNREEDPSLLWQYFGSQTGFMRTLPASKWKGDRVDLYDVRRRPWYTQGTSSPKDMMILIDTSGSTHGQALALMKVAVKSLLDTLGENDFVYIAAFSDKIHNVSCFKTFVQANYRNKKLLSDNIDDLKAGGMAMYSVAFEFAFEEIARFRRNARNGQGAHCNQVIMLLTDGGTETPTDVFKRHNWPDQPVRVFTYAIGPTANPIAAVKWMACSNRGYFSKIPAMGAIRTRVQDYVPVVSRPLVLDNQSYAQWSNIYSDALSHRTGDGVGLGMMTTVTLPVYDRGIDPWDEKEQRRKNQTILGVMGVDVTVKEMEEQVPHWKLGPNGYGFAINANGYIVFHPYLKSGSGYLKNPPNVDFLEVEVESPEKSLIRRKMIDGKEDEETIESVVISKDELHVSSLRMRYAYRAIEGTTFSLGIAIPEDHKFYIDIKNKRVKTGKTSGTICYYETGDPELNAPPPVVDDECLITEDLLEHLQPGKSVNLIASWEYCENITGYLVLNTSDAVNTLIEWATTKPDKCREESFRHLLYDALVLRNIDRTWETHANTDNDGINIEAYFVGTEGGLTKVYPPSQEEAFLRMHQATMDAYYQRAFNYKEEFVFTAPNAGYPGWKDSVNSTSISILGVTTVKVDDGAAKPVYPAVGGVKIKHSWFEVQWQSYCQDPDGHVCHLLDDGGFLISTSQQDPELLVGKFFGDVDRALMTSLFNKSIYERIEYFDYQAICPKKDDPVVASGPRSFYVPSLQASMAPFYEALNVGWWATRVSWTYISYNVYNWAFSSNTVEAYSEEEEDMHLNVSCIKKSAYYYYSPAYLQSGSRQYSYTCSDCTRKYYVNRLEKTNLLFVVAEPECLDCLDLYTQLPQKPEEDPGPDICQVEPRYRARPGDCHSQHDDEDTDDCGGASHVRLSVLASLTALLLHITTRHVTVT